LGRPVRREQEPRERFARPARREQEPRQEPRQRLEDTAEYIYGINPVSEALRSGRPLFALYILDSAHRNVLGLIRDAEKQNITVRHAGKDFFDERFGKGHQGIAAHVARKKMLSTEDIPAVLAKAKGSAFFLVADCIEDPRNFGAMLRTAEVAGVDGIIFQQQRSAGISPAVSKASAGALEYLTLIETVNIKHALRMLKDEGVMILGAEAGTDTKPWDIDLSGPIAIVMGSEGEGLRRTVKELCDAIVTLPMKGRVSSLNVSVASGILLYEVLRQRGLKN
jgi:23S rRNA (guanosine2251-2'-O)-methyltransferase